MNTSKSAYKIVIVGDSGVGKTSLSKFLRTGKFLSEHDATLGVVVNRIKIDTNFGVAYINLWDTAGKPAYSGLREGYYVEADGAILMYDACEDDTLESLPAYLQKIVDIAGGIPYVTVANKADRVEDRSQPNVIPISIKNGTGVVSMLTNLLRQITGYQTLTVTY